MSSFTLNSHLMIGWLWKCWWINYGLFLSTQHSLHCCQMLNLELIRTMCCLYSIPWVLLAIFDNYQIMFIGYYAKLNFWANNSNKDILCYFKLFKGRKNLWGININYFFLFSFQHWLTPDILSTTLMNERTEFYRIKSFYHALK